MIHFPSNKRGFHIIHQNCQSFKNKVDVVKLQIQNTGFDLFTLSETWLTDDYPDSLLSINKYNLIRIDRSWSEPNSDKIKSAGGVLAYFYNE